MFVVILDSLKFKKYVTYIKLHAIKVRSNIYWKHFDFVKGISKQDEKSSEEKMYSALKWGRLVPFLMSCVMP